MARLLILVTVILAIISFASAQVVETLNTPPGPIKQGANVIVSWTLVNGVDATGKTGTLTATDMSNQNTTEIGKEIQLAPKSFTWTVNVNPGTYTLGLNDGSGPKQSGQVVVEAGSGGAPGGASGGASGATPGTTGATASSSSTPASPDSSSTPGAVTTGSGTSGSSSGSGSSGTAGSGSGATSTTGGADQPSTSPSNISKNSASSIFSGYEVVFSLLVIAIAMVQF